VAVARRGPAGRAGPGHGKCRSNREKGHSIVEGGVGSVGTVVRNGRGGDVGTGGVGTAVRNGRGVEVGTGGVGKLVMNGRGGGVGTGGVGTLVRNGGVNLFFLVVVFVSAKNGERNPAFRELSAQMRGAGVDHASRVTCKTRRKDASTEQPKNRATLLAFGEIFWCF
jgi:hypothetical protein